MVVNQPYIPFNLYFPVIFWVPHVDLNILLRPQRGTNQKRWRLQCPQKKRTFLVIQWDLMGLTGDLWPWVNGYFTGMKPWIIHPMDVGLVLKSGISDHNFILCTWGRFLGPNHDSRSCSFQNGLSTSMLVHPGVNQHFYLYHTDIAILGSCILQSEGMGSKSFGTQDGQLRTDFRGPWWC